MIKNIEYKILSAVLTIIIVALAIVAFSPKGHTPILYNSATLDFANTAAGTATDLTVSVTGATDGDAVLVGIPNGSTVANGHFVGWVSSSGTVTVRFLNNNLLAALNPPSGVFEVIVFKKK
jgi:hypothetical protein